MKILEKLNSTQTSWRSF